MTTETTRARTIRPGALAVVVALSVMPAVTAATGSGEGSSAGQGPDGAPDGNALVRAAFEHYRGEASVGTAQMTIHRPDWERTLRMDVWTEGDAESLVRITAPAKDEGNGTLKTGDDMYLYNPKVNRVIKLPPSMMSQSWMGSDFSNNDLAKSDSLVEDYDHRVTGTSTREGHTVYSVHSAPKPGAPVVWGSLELEIRDDHVLLEERFYDEDGVLIKTLSASDVGMLGGRILPKTLRMQKAEAPSGAEGEWTELHYEDLEFRDDLPDRIFTRSNLQNPSR